MAEIDELKKENAQLKVNLEEAEKLLSYYEGDGIAKLFYSLNRKSGEIADLLNKINLSQIKLEDKDNKTFERMKVLWNEAWAEPSSKRDCSIWYCYSS